MLVVSGTQCILTRIALECRQGGAIYSVNDLLSQVLNIVYFSRVVQFRSILKSIRVFHKHTKLTILALLSTLYCLTFVISSLLAPTGVRKCAIRNHDEYKDHSFFKVKSLIGLVDFYC